MVKIVAELGINHNSNFETATKLIDAAKKAGADYVKFQVFFTLEYVKQYELPKQAFMKLFARCENVGIEWFASAFDIEAVEFLYSCGMKIWKIPSNPIVLKNIELLKAIEGTTPDSVIISTGHEQWKYSFYLFNSFNPILMCCVSKYPTPINMLNLNKIKDISGFGPFGLSDHSLSLIAPAVAVGMGATWIEKHLTLSRNQDGPDHMASLEPHEFEQMVKNVRGAEACL